MKEELTFIAFFAIQVLKVRVAKKSGKEHEELLVDDDSHDDGIWNSITR